MHLRLQKILSQRLIHPARPPSIVYSLFQFLYALVSFKLFISLFTLFLSRGLAQNTFPVAPITPATASRSRWNLLRATENSSIKCPRQCIPFFWFIMYDPCYRSCLVNYCFILFLNHHLFSLFFLFHSQWKIYSFKLIL